MGSVWKGRACWATTRVARRVEGSGFSKCDALVVWTWSCVERVELEHTSPSFGVLHDALLGLLLGGRSWHWHVGQVI
jgi:hypothetical protein